MHKLYWISGHSFVGDILGDGAVVDLGANKGEFSIFMAENFHTLTYAVEPVPWLISHIEDNAFIRKIECCISDKNGMVELFLPPDRCPTTRANSGGAAFKTSIQVQCYTLEEFMQKNLITKIGLLKVDIEGGEIGLFESLPDSVLEKISQISMEFHDFLYPELRSRVMRIKKRLQQAGFYSITFSLNNADVLFVKKEYILKVEYLYWKYFQKYKIGAVRRIKRFLANVL